ncbi:uncharacterized protein DUF2628 [Pseudomonas duriflava]|uniref:Uncharacterized protein DUF2628 n=1 Tax=Pseudomonas duriflava TaxID=459528 RepID=A0A562QKT4_9PSED|nr:DUF2628 domain-containing protein [Pseudomonas duriflava]TWI57388.1 uncharacterized protein DUF2628 [Pseudomonas duriflava]
MPELEHCREISYKPKWQERFAFFDKYGDPRSETWKAAFKSLPFMKKVLINRNWLAFFFGPVYLFILGLWKMNLTLIGIIVLIALLEVLLSEYGGIEIPQILDVGINFVLANLYALVTNYAYYLKETKNTQSWNPFKGVRL